MTEIWSSKSKFQIWLDIELYACEAMERLGTVPKGTARKVKSKAKINEKRIDQIEKKVKHDVIAFLTSISEYAGPPSRFLHQGLTSSDILDTAFNIQLKKSAKILDEELSNLLKSIKERAEGPIYRRDTSERVTHSLRNQIAQNLRDTSIVTMYLVYMRT